MLPITSRAGLFNPAPRTQVVSLSNPAPSGNQSFSTPCGGPSLVRVTSHAQAAVLRTASTQSGGPVLRNASAQFGGPVHRTASTQSGGPSTLPITSRAQATSLSNLKHAESPFSSTPCSGCSMLPITSRTQAVGLFSPGAAETPSSSKSCGGLSMLPITSRTQLVGLSSAVAERSSPIALSSGPSMLPITSRVQATGLSSPKHAETPSSSTLCDSVSMLPITSRNQAAGFSSPAAGGSTCSITPCRGLGVLPIASRSQAAGLSDPASPSSSYPAALQSLVKVQSPVSPHLSLQERSPVSRVDFADLSSPINARNTSGSLDVASPSMIVEGNSRSLLHRLAAQKGRHNTELVRARHVTETPEKPAPRRRAHRSVQYRAFVSNHGTEVSIHDRYDFGRMLGEGAVGSSWEAWPKSLNGTPVVSPTGRRDGRRAIKKMLKHCVCENASACFLEEVELLKELDHPNICKLYEVFDDTHALYLVMDLCEGGELFDRIVEDKLGGEHQVVHLIQQLVYALRYCHETHGIVHRDIKPENVLFVSRHVDAPVKLIDFGIACHFKGKELLHEKVGTEPYEAPEVLSSREYDEKCDLWSLGVLMYIVLSGEMPFGSAADALLGRFTMEADHWNHVSSQAKDLISKLLVVDPEARLSAAQVLEHPWLKVDSDRHGGAMLDIVAVRLGRFNRMSNFRQILLTVFARNLDTNDLPEMYNAFKAMDQNGDGKLSPEELQKGFSTVASKKISVEELQTIFEAIDIDGSGAIDYSEFLSAAVDRKLLFREDLCLQVFRAIDRDGDGSISMEDLSALLEDADTEEFLGSELRNEAQQILRHYDVDSDGKLDFREFTKLLTQNRLKDFTRVGLRARFLSQDSEDGSSGVETPAVPQRNAKRLSHYNSGSLSW